ncbi:MAG: hypothetical protein IPN29_05945 [Saprospiraceae bacterium]|nr:hypothetical protein [Saprospiraceae bacterium]
MIKKLRKSWMASGSTVAVYASNSSGSAQYTIVTIQTRPERESRRIQETIQRNL